MAYVLHIKDGSQNISSGALNSFLWQHDLRFVPPVLLRAVRRAAAGARGARQGAAAAV